MGRLLMLHLMFFALASSAFMNDCLVKAEDSYKYFTWTVTYGTASPLNTPQQVILINGQFPGPRIDTVTNDNIIINVINKLDQPFLLTWNGIKQRKNSWQDGVLGTNCPIPPNSNFTYKFQTKDQIGTYTYFPSTLMHKAAGGFGGLNVYARSVIAVPYAKPANDFTLLIGDWYKASHKNNEKPVQSWHLDGYDFWVVGYGSGQWAEAKRKGYNLVDATTRHTVQVLRNSWTAIFVSMDNEGMWNLRSAIWERQYLGQQLYVRVYSTERSL